MRRDLPAQRRDAERVGVTELVAAEGALGCREDDDDTVIEAKVEAVRERVAALIARGRKERDG